MWYTNQVYVLNITDQRTEEHGMLGSSYGLFKLIGCAQIHKTICDVLRCAEIFGRLLSIICEKLL